MEIIKITDKLVFERAREVLLNGGVVMHPTETCYGFAVDIFNEDALKKVYRLKGRDFKNPVSILVDSIEMAMKYGEFDKKALELVDKYWPGPLSIVVPRKSELPSFLNPGEDFVSIRFSSDEFCLGMVSAFSGPVTTTSSNVSGESPLYEADVSHFGEMSDEIDLLVDGGVLDGGPVSTVVKVANGEVEVLREGTISL